MTSDLPPEGGPVRYKKHKGTGLCPEATPSFQHLWWEIRALSMPVHAKVPLRDCHWAIECL